jgi:hypothetical protein
MKKHYVYLLTLFTPLTTLANTYVGVGIQSNNPSIQDETIKQMSLNDVTLNLQKEGTSSDLYLFIGHRFDNNWGIELGFTAFEQSAERENIIDYLHEEEWEADADYTQISIEASYLYPITDSLKLVGAVGILHHNADFNASYKIDVENGPDINYINLNQSDSSVGGLASIGVQYQVYKNVDIIAKAQYARSSIVGNSSIMLSASYTF